ncbi:MAG: tRNA glutamyl-Q(34) synthetase GluQRS, partial [Phycisphaerae bacterium]|nr:tRNA glutamyl-Q(34) synthetase GluQRS [Phycisphaerae bacterium]
MSNGRTRLAPSPTGALHLGNARTFLVNWALARQRGWHIVLRIEDLDGPRLKPGADQLAIDILKWLGLNWDEGPHYQKHHLAPYRAALEQLAEAGLTYPCHCTRAQIQSALSAPHADQAEPRYPGTCRPAEAATVAFAVDEDLRPAWRLRVPDETIEFKDAFAGPRSVNVHEQVGDFVIATRHQLPAYQLAVVVDDAAQGIDRVVRADDLIDSTGRQLLLYRLLNLSPAPHYLHLPLVLGPDGRRLAKRHGDTRVASYRDQGVSPA